MRLPNNNATLTVIDVRIYYITKNEKQVIKSLRTSITLIETMPLSNLQKGVCMIKKYFLTFFILAVGFGISATNVFAYDDTEFASSLRDVGTVYVNVRNIDEDVRAQVKKGGLTEELLKVMMIRKLEAAGIQAFSGYESVKSAKQALLNLKLYILSPDLTQKTIRTVDDEKVPRGKAENRYLYAAILEFRQPVTLERDSNITLSASTWTTEFTGFRRVKGIHADVSGMVDSFVQAYNAANAKHK